MKQSATVAFDLNYITASLTSLTLIRALASLKPLHFHAEGDVTTMATVVYTYSIVPYADIPKTVFSQLTLLG